MRFRHGPQGAEEGALVIGVAVTFGCIVLGTLLATIDPVSGIALIVGGGLGGLVITWNELS